MKILQVIPSFVPAYAYGGPLRVAYGISKELVKRGHEVTVYTTDVYDHLSRLKYTENPEYMDGIRVYRFKNISNKLATTVSACAPAMFIAFKREIRNFDIIHLHDYRSFQALFAHHSLKKYGVPYVLQAHGNLGQIMGKQALPRIYLRKLYDSLWGYRLLRDAGKVVALSKTETEQYKTMGVSEDRIEIVPNGIDLSEFEDLPQRGEFREKYGFNKNQKVILYLGRINQIKGLDLLVKAFAQLAQNVSEAKLVIVGPDDGYLSALKTLVKELKIEEKVLFTGPLYERDKLEAYIDADIYVLPCAVEFFGLTLLEACSCGTPVICSQGCGIADVIGDKVGLVFPYDKGQLEGALMRILSDSKMRQEFGEHGRLLVYEQFTWSRIVEKLEHIYLEARAIYP